MPVKRIIDLPVKAVPELTDLLFDGAPADGQLFQITIQSLLNLFLAAVTDAWTSLLSNSLGAITGVPGSSTRYFQTSGRQSSLITDETTIRSAIPADCTAANLVVVTHETQAADGDLVITLIVNGAQSALIVTIPANSPAGVYSNTSDTVALVLGDVIDYEGANAATTTATTIESIAIKLSGV